MKIVRNPCHPPTPLRWGLGYGLLLILLVATGLEAQEVEFGSRGRPAAFRKLPSGEPVPVIVVAHGARVRRAPAKLAPEAGRGKFLDQYFLADVAEEGGRKYYLAAQMDELTQEPSRFVGWFAAGEVLTDSRALKDKPGIYLKGLIVNQWQEAADRGVKIEGASALNGPGERLDGDPYDQVAELGLFQFYFVYQRHQTADGDAYYLLGYTPTIPNITSPAETLVGWVRKGRIYEWSTRQAVQFDKKTLDERVKAQPSDTYEGTKIFETRRELVAHLRGEEALEGMALRPVAVEDTRVRHWQHNWQRFPLFEVLRNKDMPSAGALYRVGYIGDQIYVESGRSGAGATEVAENQERLHRLRRELKHIDVLFVIDSTGSMRNYFRPASEAVMNITREVQAAFPVAEDSPDIRFSVLFYRDYADEDGKPEPTDTYLTKRLPLTGNVQAVQSFLEQEEGMICNGCGGDEPEAVFHGIDYAITAGAGEVEDIGFRAVVLLGDKGNHRRDPRGYTVNKVAQVLKDQSYDFFCIHVASAEQVRGDGDARAFRDQCDQIEKLVQVSSLTNPERVETRDPREVAQAIVDAALTVAEDVRDTEEATVKLSRGEAGLKDIKLQYGVRLTRRLSDMMVKRGIDPRVFLEKSVQLFGEGWVAGQDPLSSQRQVETVLLVDRPTLEQLMGMLAGFTKDPPARKNVVEVWTKVLKDVTTGDLDVEKPVAELIESHLGIPVRKKLLHRTLDQISNLNPEELAGLWSELTWDLHRIRGIYSEKELILSKKPRGGGGFDVEVKEGGTRKVWWQGHGREYAWIPLDELP